jgi:hypothetical protein
MRIYRSYFLLLSTALVYAHVSPAQSTYRARIVASLQNQPHWTSPLVTTSPRIEEGLNAEFVRQTSGRQTTWIYGNSKGLQIIPLPRIELRISPPPFFAHSNPRVDDGFGDFALRLKYRFYGSNETHHNALVSGSLQGSLPTGKSGNGSCCAILTPTVYLAKGFGRLALTSSAGAAFPVSGTHKLGRPVQWNNAIQLHTAGPLWLQTEFNATFFEGGRNDGRQQLFTTPGLVLSRLPLNHGAGQPSLQFTVGIGEQIALTHFSTYNHAPIFVGRLRF